MKKYEILEHKADLKIKIFGKTKEVLFQNALLGMISAFRAKIKSQKSKVKIIQIKSHDSPTLLVDFLSEVLYLIQTNKEIYNKVKFTKLTDAELEARLFGQKVERFGEDIKAATYHDLSITKNKKGMWEAVILFDI